MFSSPDCDLLLSGRFWHPTLQREKVNLFNWISFCFSFSFVTSLQVNIDKNQHCSCLCPIKLFHFSTLKNRFEKAENNFWTCQCQSAGFLHFLVRIRNENGVLIVCIAFALVNAFLCPWIWKRSIFRFRNHFYEPLTLLDFCCDVT